jgi:hypothetical protein
MEFVFMAPQNEMNMTLRNRKLPTGNQKPCQALLTHGSQPPAGLALEENWVEHKDVAHSTSIHKMLPREPEALKQSDDLWVLRESEVPYSPERGRDLEGSDVSDPAGDQEHP